MKQPIIACLLCILATVCTAAASNANDLTIAKLVSSAYLLCFTGDPNQNTEQNTKSPFLVDEFKIWNYAKTTFDLP